MEFKNLNDLTRYLEKKVEEVNGEVSFSELFNESFMQEYTKFNSIDDFFENSPFEVKTQEDLEKINLEELNSYVKVNTKFSSWDEMKARAGEKYIAKKLKF